MSLQRTDTGEPSKPLQELHERNLMRKEEYDTALLKEALATSNEKCNGLIVQQNTLIKEQNMQIMEIRSDIAAMEYKTQMTVNKAVRQMEAESLQASQIKSEIKQTIKSEIMTTANEMRDYEKSKIDESISEIKKELSATAKEIEKQKEDMKTQGIWCKIFFWATPVLLFIDTILLIIFMS